MTLASLRKHSQVPRLFGIALLALLASALVTLAEKKVPPPSHSLEITIEEAKENLLDQSKIVIHRQTNASSALFVKIEVDETGRVSSVDFDADTSLSEVEVAATLSQLRTRSYKPFRRNGRAVPVHFDELLLPEAFVARPMHVPFPPITDLSSVAMTLSRGGCFGSCPSYEVKVGGMGRVTFSGDEYVAVAGTHHDQISQADVARLIDAFRQADYFSLDANYSALITDHATYTTSITIGKQTKRVRDYVGLKAGMPAAVMRIEEEIDRIAGTEKWIKTNAHTVPSLKRDHFEFASGAGANLLAEAAKSGTVEVVRALLQAGAPLHGKSSDVPYDVGGLTALSHVAARGRPDMLDILLRSGSWSAAELTDALWWATSIAHRELMTSLIRRGADPRGRAAVGSSETGYGYSIPGSTILHAAVVSGVPDIVKFVLRYKPDLEARTEDGRTPLLQDVQSYLDEGDTRKVDEKQVVRLLVEAGANINALNGQGETLLADTYDEDVALTLIELGADLSVKNQYGSSILEVARGNEWSKVLAALEARGIKE